MNYPVFPSMYFILSTINKLKNYIPEVLQPVITYKIFIHHSDNGLVCIQAWK